jgi:hypothetical protein
MALRALRQDHQAEPARVFLVLTNYLRQRLDLTVVEPTPPEVTEHLRRIGVARVLRGKFAEFFQACDAGRFAPQPEANGVRRTDLQSVQQKRTDCKSVLLANDAANLIQALEAEPCFTRPS